MIFDDYLETQRWIDRLDEVAISYEAKWGIGFLQRAATPDFKTKWDRQREKLAAAVGAKNLPLVSELVEGTIRAWAALERNVMDQGIQPRHADVWEVQLESGFRLKVTKTKTDARAVPPEGVSVWSLEELARVIEKHYEPVNVLKSAMPGAEVVQIKEPMDWKNGDKIPEF